jgi:hypothetical protein
MSLLAHSYSYATDRTEVPAASLHTNAQHPAEQGEGCAAPQSFACF